MSTFSIGQLATLACTLEVCAPKPGNVHRGAEFTDLTLEEMLCSAVAIAPAMDAATSAGVGVTVLSAVRATRQVARSNTNLGTILLLAPLAAVDRGIALQEGVQDVLGHLQPADSAAVYEAIRLAVPGGMGRSSEHDIEQPPPDSLIVAMRAAENRDLVAAQYAQDFRDFFEIVVPRISTAITELPTARRAIVHAHLQLMAEFPDSLIARKCGAAVARESAARARRVLNSGTPGSESYQAAAADFDFWLRSDGHARNPGTTADFIAAGLFACLREGRVEMKSMTWSDGVHA